MERTTKQWWSEIKASPERLAAWLRRQYVGELAAVNLLSEVLLQYGSAMSQEQWADIYKVMQQEALHGSWMKRLMDDRGIRPEPNASATRRYWNEVLPAVDSFEKAAAAAFNAERMRLFRIREIANDADAPPDIREVFKAILPHEEWHEQVFDRMRGSTDLSEPHARGLRALSLVLG